MPSSKLALAAILGVLIVAAPAQASVVFSDTPANPIHPNRLIQIDPSPKKAAARRHFY